MFTMIKWLYKILFVAITFSFFISATEMDLGDCHNTFFDDYDTYVKTEQVSFDNTVITIHPDDIHNLLFYHVLFQYNELADAISVVVNKHKDCYNNYPPKLFLRNSVWRI